MKFATVILAAGQGTRMRSDLPKVLHCIAGKPLLQYSLDLVDGLMDSKPVVVVGHKAEQVQEVVGEQGPICYSKGTIRHRTCRANR